MNRLRKFWGLPARTQRFLLKTLGLVWLIRLGLWLLPFRTLRHLTEKLTTLGTNSSYTAWPTPEQIAGSVALTSRYVPQATCLTQALATQVLLGRAGHQAILHIGVARSEQGQFQAHAWVESQGRVVIGGSEAELERYARLLAWESGS